MAVRGTSVRVSMGVLVGAALLGCAGPRIAPDGAPVGRPAGRSVGASDVALAPGYRIEPVAVGLMLPVAIATDARGRVFVIEAGRWRGRSFGAPRLLELGEDGTPREIARGVDAAWTGLAVEGGVFYVAEAGARRRGRILRIDEHGTIKPLVQDLPSLGDHHTGGVILGADHMLYFGQGTATNAGVVGPDNSARGWLDARRDVHDIPCRDVTLRGIDYESPDPFTPHDDRVRTGAFVPFGTPTRAGERVKGRLPCTGAILRVGLDGGVPDLVAWGLRNPQGLAFAPNGQLYASDNGYDERGSRPIRAAADVLWRIDQGRWYGWPDYAEGRPVSAARYQMPDGDRTALLLAAPPEIPPEPVAHFGAHSASDGLDFSRSARFGFVGDAFVAQFGDEGALTGKVRHPVGFRVVRVEVGTGVVRDFAINRAPGSGPASRLGSGGLERPIAVRFSGDGRSLYVLDFGVVQLLHGHSSPQPGTGVVWRIFRNGTGA